MESQSGDQERKFVQLGPDSIVLAGESVGLTNLQGPVTRALAEDVTYRTREVASLAALFLKHARKRKLTVEDMNYAMKWSDVEPVVGQGCGQEVSVSQLYNYVPEAEVFVDADTEIDLIGNIKTEQKPITEEEPRLSITASWLHVEGGDSPALSGALQQYYKAVVTYTLGDSEELCVTILRDVASNGKIAPLLPYLITFIRQAMKRFPTKSLLQTRMLRLISAIFSNPQLNLSPKPYLSHLVTALLTTVLCQDVSSVDHVTLATTILHLALSRWATPVNQLKCQTLKHLKDFVTSERGQGWAQYGALSCLILLGPELVTDTLTPWPPQLWPHLESLSGQQTEVSCLQWAAIRRAGACIINHWIDQASPDHNWSLYQDLYQHFADSLLPQLKLIRRGHSTPANPSRRIIKYSDSYGRIKYKKFSSSKKRKTNLKNGESNGSNMEQILTASQNFDILADMGVPSDIFEPVSDLERCEGLPDLLGEPKPSSSVSGGGGGGGMVVRATGLSRSVQEMFPDSGPVLSPRQRAARLVIQCPLLSITALPRDRLRPPGGRGGAPEVRPVTVEWSNLVVGGRPGLRRRQRRPGKIGKIASYVNILMTCA